MVKSGILWGFIGVALGVIGVWLDPFGFEIAMLQALSIVFVLWWHETMNTAADKYTKIWKPLNWVVGIQAIVTFLICGVTMQTMMLWLVVVLHVWYTTVTIGAATVGFRTTTITKCCGIILVFVLMWLEGSMIGGWLSGSEQMLTIIGNTPEAVGISRGIWGVLMVVGCMFLGKTQRNTG